MSSMRCPSCARLYASSERFCSHDGIALEPYQPDDPLVGTELLGRYRVLRPLGRGGMGVVYLAEQRGIGRTVALKVLAAERSVDPTARVRFEREARLIAEMRSPHTVALYDFGAAEDGRLVLVMEHVEGETLRALLNREGALPTDRAARLVEQVARSLTEAHSRGVVHRDIKPSNVLSAPTPDYPDLVKVVDFGIAALVDDRAATRLTITEEAPGTPTYMAPECVAGETPDARADVYALGVLLFEMLAGRPPFSGNSAQEVMTAQLETEAPLLSDVASTPLPDGVVTLVARCLAKQRALRPKNAGEFREALGIAMGWSDDGRAVQRTSDATLPRASRKPAVVPEDDATLDKQPLVATDAPLPELTAPPTPPAAAPRRQSILWAASGAVVLVAVAMVVVLRAADDAPQQTVAKPVPSSAKGASSPDADVTASAARQAQSSVEDVGPSPPTTTASSSAPDARASIPDAARHADVKGRADGGPDASAVADVPPLKEIPRATTDARSRPTKPPRSTVKKPPKVRVPPEFETWIKPSKGKAK